MPLAKSSDFYAKMLKTPDSVRIVVPCHTRTHAHTHTRTHTHTHTHTRSKHTEHKW